MLKIEKEYENKYGNIPYDLSGRIDILCKALKKKRKKYKKDIFAEIAKIYEISNGTKFLMSFIFYQKLHHVQD